MNTTVLTVDDDPSFLEMLRYLLSEEKEVCVVGEARDGEQAVQAAQQLSPDIVLMDISMPVVNGFDATRRIKIFRPQTKVIIFSVHSETQYETAAYEYGADGFLAKRRLAMDLVPAIRHLLGDKV